MYCEKCWSKNSENATFCTNCGNKLSNSEPNDQVLESSTPVDNNVNNVQNSNVVTNEEEPVYNNVNNAQTNVVTEPEGSKFGWGVLGFFVPLVGLILYFSWKKDRPKTAKAAGIGALVSVVLNVILAIILVVISINMSSDKGLIIDTIIKDYDDNIPNTTIKNEFNAGDTFKFGDFEIVIGKNYTFDKINNEYSTENGKIIVKVPITVKNTGVIKDCISSSSYSVLDPNGQALSDQTFNFDDTIGCSNELQLEQNQSYTRNLYFEYTKNGLYKIKFEDLFNSAQVSINISK